MYACRFHAQLHINGKTVDLGYRVDTEWVASPEYNEAAATGDIATLRKDPAAPNLAANWPEAYDITITTISN